MLCNFGEFWKALEMLEGWILARWNCVFILDVRRLNFSKVELCVYFRWVLFRLSAFFFTPLLTFLLLYGVSVFTSWISYNFGFSHWLLRFVKTEFCCSNFTQFQGPKWDLGGVKKKCGGPKENFSLFYGSNEKSI
jgi:hypothetical protein